MIYCIRLHQGVTGAVGRRGTHEGTSRAGSITGAHQGPKMMYCWGNNADGQLGLEQAMASAPTKWDYFHRKRVSAVGCGERHTLFLAGDGTVFSCGANDKGQCGRRREDPRIDQIQALETCKIVHVSCGKEHSLAICDRGNIYSWGCGSDGQLGLGDVKEKVCIPKRIEQLSTVHIIQIACGHHHSLALSKDGRVYSWGQNTHGQLGLGKGFSSQASPQQVKSLSGLPLAQIAAGGAHSFALSLSGAMFGWGNNSAGQLGLGSGMKGQFKPCLVAGMKNIGVSFISCGQDHTAVLTKDGDVFTCGDGTYGQLGHGTTANEYGPQKVKLIDGKVSQLACGSHHTMAYVPASDLIVSFGHGTFGQLGSGALSNKTQPSTVADTWSNDNNQSASATAPQGATMDLSILYVLTDFKDAAMKSIFAGMNVNFLQILPSQESADADLLLGNLQQISRIDGPSVEKWMAARVESDEQKEADSEIASVFSSCAAVNASFLKQSTPDSLEVCSASAGVDLVRARQTFDELTQRVWIASKIYCSLRQKLIPDLLKFPPHKEALAIFLILPECSVMHSDLYCLSLVIPFAEVIIQLSQPSQKILTKWWSSLQASYLNKQVQMFNRAVVCLLKSWSHMPQQNHDLKTLLQTLKLLYKANLKAQAPLPLNKFYINEVPMHVDFVGDLINWRVWQKEPASFDKDNMPAIFCRFPFILNLLAKILVLHMDSLLKQKTAHHQIVASFHQQVIWGRPSQPPELPVFYLKINQKNLIENTLRQLNAADDSNFRKQLVVHFVGEEGLNQRREFFLYIFEEMVQQNYGLFMYLDNASVIWFPPSPSMETKKYFLFGILCGLAVYNLCIVHLPFPLALFKKLLDVEPTFEDFKAMDPNYGRTLQYLLDYKHDDFEENLTIFFETSWGEKHAELIPNGKSMPVNNANKGEFVSKFVDYVFNKSVKVVFEEFKRGFYKVCDKEILEFFQPQELMEVMVGNADYDWEKLKRNTIYSGEYHALHPSITMFWKVFQELLLNEKKDFLLFLTGSNRIPVFGMDAVKIQISSLHLLSPDHLPEARTCYNILMLPRYPTAEILKERLLRAIRHNQGFWKE